MSPTTTATTLRKVRAHDGIPYHVEHADFEADDAFERFGPEENRFEVILKGHMIDEVTRERAKRMHYAAYRLEHAEDDDSREYWRSIYHDYRNQIVMGNRKLIFRAVQRWSPTPMMEDDLIGDCQIVFVQAVGAYNPWMGIRFSTYAFTCLMRALSRLSQKTSWDRSVRRVSMDTLADPEEDADEGKEVGTAFIDPYLREDNDLLTEREKKVIVQRYRLGDHDRAHTLEEVGRDLGLSKERVRQVQSIALEKLRAALATPS